MTMIPLTNDQALQTIAEGEREPHDVAVLSGRDYSDMINTTRVRSSLRRLFGGSTDEIFGELLQNAQRANASVITMSISDDGWTFADNGDGLRGGLDGFWTLLRIAETYYNNPTILAQDAMGLGIHALLAHAEIHEVTFTSGNQALTIQTDAWWNDEAYYTSWHERVTTLDEAIAGFHIAVRCASRLLNDVRKSLESVDLDMYLARKWSPFQGYADIFTSVTCDGVPVRTTSPRFVTPKHVLVKTEYQGQELIIGSNWDGDSQQGYYGGDRGRATCNWYGQLIPMKPLGSWVYHLKVRDGRPVNPKSPSRQGVIEDAALEALQAFVRDAIFMTLADPANRECITPMLVQAAYLLDHRRAGRLPYLVVAPYLYDRNGSNTDELGGLGDYVIVTYDDVPLLLADEVAIDRTIMDAETQAAASADGSTDEVMPETEDVLTAPAVSDDTEPVAGFDVEEHGFSSFVPVLKAAGITPYKLMAGNGERVSIQTLHWQPGAARADEFNELGRYGFGSDDALPTEWHDVTGVTSVFAFTDPSSWDATDVNWTVGTTDPLSFLASEVWFGFSPDDDEDHDPQEDQYRDSVNAWKRRLIGDCVPRHFDYYDVQRQMPTRVSPIVSIKYVLPRKKRSVEIVQDDRQPTAIIVRNAVGERKQLKLVA